MRLLLDTHIFLWLIENNKHLSDKHRQAIQNSNNQKYFERCLSLGMRYQISSR